MLQKRLVIIIIWFLDNFILVCKQGEKVYFF